MIFGAAFALQEITLVLFTTLSPAGALACAGLCVLACMLPECEVRRRILNYMGLAIAFTAVGFVASATHLGDVGNVLYVLTRVGASPLSSEVACVAAFFFLVGTFWLYSFAQNLAPRVCVVWTVSVCGACLAMLVGIGFAYSAEAVITWNAPYVPACVWANALLGAPFVMLATLEIAHLDVIAARLRRPFALVATLALALNVALYGWQLADVSNVANSIMSATQAAPWHPVALVLFVMLALAALALQLPAARAKTHARALALDAVSCLCVFAAIFCMRFTFYALHLTAGLGV